MYGLLHVMKMKISEISANDDSIPKTPHTRRSHRVRKQILPAGSHYEYTVDPETGGFIVTGIVAADDVEKKARTAKKVQKKPKAKSSLPPDIAATSEVLRGKARKLRSAWESRKPASEQVTNTATGQIVTSVVTGESFAPMVQEPDSTVFSQTLYRSRAIDVSAGMIHIPAGKTYNDDVDFAIMYVVCVGAVSVEVDGASDTIPTLGAFTLEAGTTYTIRAQGKASAVLHYTIAGIPDEGEAPEPLQDDEESDESEGSEDEELFSETEDGMSSTG